MAIYYFSTTDGLDTRTSGEAQNSATPWQTITKLNSFMSSMTSGDSVLFKKGDTFQGVGLVLAKSGINFGSYGSGANPIISGFTDLTWTSLGSNLYESQVLSVRPNLVMISGAYRLPARMPKSSYYTYESSAAGSITDNQLTGSWTGATVVVRKNHTIWDKGIATQSGTTLSFTSIYGDGFTNGYGFFLQDHISACTVQGDWAWNTNKIRVFSTTSPTNCKAATVLNTIDSNGFSAVFDGIDVTGSNEVGINVNNVASGGFIFKNGTVSNHGDRGIYIQNSPSSLIENCSISNINAIGAEATNCTDIIFRSNTFTNVGIEGQGIYCEYNGLILYGGNHNALVELNSLSNIGHNGISFYFSNDVTIQKNLLDGFNTVKDDGGGIYSYLGIGNGSYTGIVVDSNIVLNATGAPQARTDTTYIAAYGIYMDNDVANVTISNNVVANGVTCGLYLHSANHITVTNNLFYNNCSATQDRGSQVFFNGDGTPITNIVFTGNIMFAKEVDQYQIQLDYGTDTISSSFTTLNNNYYCHPISESTFVSRTYISGDPTAIDHTFSAWKTYTGKDTTSSQTYRTISATSELRFEYNATNTTVNRSLTDNYKNQAGTLYSGTISLPAYSGAILLFDSVASQITTVNIFSLRG